MTTTHLSATRLKAADLEMYLKRVGYSGPRTATKETLRELHNLHPQAIAFENLDPLLGRLPLPLDVASLLNKLVRQERGGYCFEQNLLFGHVLATLGFDVSGLAARILWNQPPDVATPRGHMLLRVHLGGEDYIADVGFGALTLTSPLHIKVGLSQDTPHETFRIVDDNDLFRLDARLAGRWRPVYRFDLQKQTQADYEITNFYLSSHPDSHFRHSLIAARPFAEGRYALLGNRLTYHLNDGSSERKFLSSKDELKEVLSSLFHIKIPDGFDALEIHAETNSL